MLLFTLHISGTNRKGKDVSDEIARREAQK
jgi:hypothetical protein